jgi:hypothetical protein
VGMNVQILIFKLCDAKSLARARENQIFLQPRWAAWRKFGCSKLVP